MDTTTEYSVHDESQKAPALPGISLNWFIFFLIWPFAALVTALRRFREPFAKTIFWLFCVYFGFVFVYDYLTPGKVTADSAYYAEELFKMHENKITFNELTNKFYKVKGEIDIYQPLITWLVSFITKDPRILFAVFAAIFGFFYSQNLWLIYNRVNKNVGWLLLLLMIYYALINPIWNINGVRMYTAAHIYLYGNLVYFLNGKKSGLLWVIISMLVHFSFTIMVIFCLVFLFIPRNINGLLIFFVFSSLIKEIDIELIRNILIKYIPEIFQPRVEAYLSNDYVNVVRESRQELSWVVRFNGIATRFIIYIWIFLTYVLFKKGVSFKDEINKIFSIALFLGGFAQIMSLLPSGGRFLVLSNSLFLATFILLISNYKISYYRFLQLLTFPLLLYVILFTVRIGFNFTGFLAFFGNPFLSYFIHDQTALIYLIKQIF